MKNIHKIILVVMLILSDASYAISTVAKQALLIDASTNAILYSKNANEKMYPSSMSKLMTLYIVFEKLKENQLSLKDKFIVSKNAWKRQGSRMFLLPDTEVTVEDLLRGVVVQSGNDATVALAEGIYGSEPDFVVKMNAKAKQLGLVNSNFENSTGWPDKNHYMTAEDLVKLSQRIIKDFPEYYHYFSETEFTYNKITQPNRNTLISKEIAVDGLKTGNTDIGGYGIVASSSKEGRRLIVLVNGLRSMKEREVEAQKLLQYGFLNFMNFTISSAEKPLASTEVWLGSQDKVNLVVREDIVFTIPRDQKDQLKATLKYADIVAAPFRKDSKIGEIEVLLNNQTFKFDLYPEEDIAKAGFLRRMISKMKYYMKNLSLSGPKVSTKVQELIS